MPARAAPTELGVHAVDDLAAHENFPVASRLLPAAQRADLMAVYGFARLVDDLGDESAGDRLAELAWAEAELDRAFAGHADHPVFVRLGVTVRRCHLPRQPFADLIEANRIDQRVTRYASWDDLMGYCDHSADPVGRIVLGVFGLATAERVAWSDDVCSGLQVVEHLQDVGEDARRDRVYLPQDVLAAHGVTTADLLAPAASAGLRATVRDLADRAQGLLGSGVPLTRSLHGRPRFAVAGYCAGGLAALDAIARADHDVLAAPRRGRRHRLALEWAGVLGAATRPGAGR
jgi:squalene synthase HpnC